MIGAKRPGVFSVRANGIIRVLNKSFAFQGSLTAKKLGLDMSGLKLLISLAIY